MLKIISVLTLLYFLSSTALPESSSKHDVNQGFNDNSQQPLPLQLAEAASRSYYGAGGKHAKPCSRRKNQDGLNVADQELLPTPTYSARVVKTYQGNANTNLEPQSLRNVLSKDNVEENYDKVNELYSYSDVLRNEAQDLTSKSDSGNAKTAENSKPEEVSNDDNKETSNRNALHSGKEDSVQYGNQNDNYNNGELNKSDFDSKNAKPYSKRLTVAQHTYKNAEAKNDNLDENNDNVKNADAHSDKVNAKNDDVENKADNKEFDGDHDYKISKVNSEELGALEYDSRNTKAHSEKSESSNYGVKNAQSHGKELTGLYHKQKDNANYDAKIFQAHGKELDDAQSKSYEKYLTVSLMKAKNAEANSDELGRADYSVKDTKHQQDVLSAEHRGDKSSRVHDSENKGLYSTPNKNKVHNNDFNKAQYKKKYYKDDLGSETNKKTSRLSDEIEEALYGVRRNRADSDELNNALYEIRKHLAHSEELKDALREVGKKGKTYSDVLSDALYKVKKHKAHSEELNNDYYGDKSNKQDYSPNKKSESKYHSVSKPEYKGFDQQSRAGDSDEDDHKCPSKQRTLAAKHESKDATRRFLSDTRTESESANSASSEDVAQKEAEHEKKYDDDDKNDSETAENKEGEDFESENYENNAYVEQTGATAQRRNPKPGYGYELTNPAQGPGVSELSANGFNLMDHTRVCYACSSDYNPSCYEPTRQTTVKYCRFGHDKCITKTFTDRNDKHSVVIRDCADSCSVGTSGFDPVWNSCDVCTDDLCNDKLIVNGAFSINSQSLVFTVLVIFAIKFTM